MEKKLYRNVNDKVLGGVASGLAEYLDIDVTVVRIAFLLLFFFGGSGFLIYIIMWIAVPTKKNFSYTTDYRVYEDPLYQRPVEESNMAPRQRSGNSRFWAGLALVVFGLYFLSYEFHFIPYWFSIGKLWPLIFIIPGLIILSNSRRKDETSSYTYTATEEKKEKTFNEGVNADPNPSTNTDSTNPPTSTPDNIDTDPTNDKI